jgi:hypothetical protein
MGKAVKKNGKFFENIAGLLRCVRLPTTALNKIAEVLK